MLLWLLGSALAADGCDCDFLSQRIAELTAENAMLKAGQVTSSAEPDEPADRGELTSQFAQSAAPEARPRGTAPLAGRGRATSRSIT